MFPKCFIVIYICGNCVNVVNKSVNVFESLYNDIDERSIHTFN
jgi:hypothetical protein